MESFSQRKGIEPIRSEIQSDTMDDRLRTGLWNVFQIHYAIGFWSGLRKVQSWRGLIPRSAGFRKEDFERLFQLFQKLWCEHLHLELDEFHLNVPDSDETYRVFKDHFFQCRWNEAYDFIEFLPNNHLDQSISQAFMQECNAVLARESSAYRFINGMITPVVEEEQVSAIEQALQSSTSLVRAHLQQAQKLLSDKKNPDYRNSMKDSISAVECLCKLITGDDKATLGRALNVIESKAGLALHADLKEALRKLYGYTSDADGIRHALKDDPNLALEDALFMFVTCSAFVNYLTVKASKAGITLQ